MTTPIRALDREDADGKDGERTKWLKQAFKDAKARYQRSSTRWPAPRSVREPMEESGILVATHVATGSRP